MTSYHSHGVKLSQGQKQKLAKALRNNSAITIRLSHDELNGPDQLMLTKSQINRLRKSMENGTGSDIKISKTQIRKAVKMGGSLWSSLFSLGARALPAVTSLASKAAGPLATGALSGLASLGVDKIFGKGQVGGFLIPQNKVGQLIKYKDWLTNEQKKQIVNAIHTGGQIVIKPTKSQSGGFLGTLLASIGVPLLLNALTGKGLQVDRERSRRSVPVYVPKNTNGGLVLPADYRPPPFYGTWKQPIVGMGVKKKNLQKRKRVNTGKKQSYQRHPTNRRHIVKFINKPLSNFDLINWVKQLGIKYFRGVFSKDKLPTSMINYEVGIINLDDYIGSGTHWVAYRNGNGLSGMDTPLAQYPSDIGDNKYAEYFDSFGLPMPKEVEKYLSTSGKPLIYSSDEIQDRDSVLCGYWCLYYLIERQKGKSIPETIHNTNLHLNTTDSDNHEFIINYFKNIV